MKVAVVDDGVDQSIRSSTRRGSRIRRASRRGTRVDDAEGDRRARASPGRARTARRSTATSSFHGTFVAGVIAGVKTDVEAGQTGFCIEVVRRLPPRGEGCRGESRARVHRQLPRLQRSRAVTARRLLLGEQPRDRRRVRGRGASDGMDVINFSGGGPAGRSAHGHPHRGGVECRARGRRARSSRLGTTGTSSASALPARRRRLPTPSASAQSPTRTSSAPSLSVVSPSGLPADARSPLPTTIPPSWISANQRLVDVGSIAGVSRQLCDCGSARVAGRRDRARQPRRLPVRREGGARARRRARSGS